MNFYTRFPHALVYACVAPIIGNNYEQLRLRLRLRSALRQCRDKLVCMWGYNTLGSVQCVQGKIALPAEKGAHSHVHH
jgi:hypothetical protein